MGRTVRGDMKAFKHFTILMMGIIFLMGIGCKQKKTEVKDILLDTKLNSMQSEIDDLSLRVLELESNQNLYKSIYLDTSHPKTYQRIETITGIFLIMFSDITPYLEGYKINLLIGNPSSAMYKGFTLKITWGKKFDSKQMKYREWKESLKHKNFSFVDTLMSGTWNKAQVIISPAKPEELGWLALEMDTDIAWLKLQK